MDGPIRFPSRQEIPEQASVWLARLDRGLSAQEREALETWLAADARHREALIQMGALWDEMDVLADLSGLFPLEQYAAPRERRLTPLIAATAACTVLVFTIWFGLTRTGAAPESEPLVIAKALPPAVSYETAIGEQLSVLLSDGSRLMLNTNTLLEVQYTAAERTIFLRRGESNFAVAHDPGRPFAVRAGGHVVQAIGTAFNVQLGSADTVEVVVTEGRVRVSETTDPRPGIAANASNIAATGSGQRAPVETTVSAGEVALVTSGAESVRTLPPAEVAIRLSWQRGILVFRGEPLSSVLEEVSRYTTVDFVIADPSLREVRVGGYFYPNDVEGLLLALAKNFQIAAHREGADRIVLTRQ